MKSSSAAQGMVYKIAIGYLVLVLVMSLVTFAIYGIDKFQARREGWRTSERTLHRLSLLGGWPGAWAGQKFFRHKTQKRGFQFVYWAIVFLHLGLIAAAVYFWAVN